MKKLTIVLFAVLLTVAFSASAFALTGIQDSCGVNVIADIPEVMRFCGECGTQGGTIIFQADINGKLALGDTNINPPGDVSVVVRTNLPGYTLKLAVNPGDELQNAAGTSIITFDPNLRATNGGADLGPVVSAPGPTLPGGDLYFIGGTINADQWPLAEVHNGVITATLEP